MIFHRHFLPFVAKAVWSFSIILKEWNNNSELSEFYTAYKELRQPHDISTNPIWFSLLLIKCHYVVSFCFQTLKQSISDESFTK